MKRIPVLFAVIILFASAAMAQSEPLSSDAILKQAYEQAAKEKKNVFVIFHASWCGWCHKMDSAMNDKSCKKFFDDNFVVRHLVVLESKDKKNLENPGAEELRKKYHGEKSGIPLWLVFDPKGNLLGDSQIRAAGASLDSEGTNVGCPAQPEEVAHFIEILKKTTKLNSSQLAIIEARFSKNKS
ncbi:MAG: thioredoxin family protein [Chitinophagaceae bacterium]